MKDFINKYWIHALGVSLLFIAFLLFLKLAVQNGWLPIELKLALSTVLGFSLMFFGFRSKSEGFVGELCSGLGAAVLYATVGFISFSDVFDWSDGSLLISMIVLGGSVTALSVKRNLRILFGIGILGGFITPFILEASAKLDFALFIYILLLNIFCIYVAILKNWKENLIGAFLLTGALYASYYFIFDPNSWQRPFTYVTALFVVFTVGFMISFNREKHELGASELLLSVVNGIHFIFWSNFILKQFELSHVLPLGLVGLTFFGCSSYIYLRSKKSAVAASLVYLLLAILSLVIVANDLSKLYVERGLNYVFICAIWVSILYATYFFGRKFKDFLLQMLSVGGFFLLVTYWFTKAWEVDWLPVLGVKYIPFLNPGALIWISLVFLGFLMSLDFKKGRFTSSRNQITESRLLGLSSHLIVGGLLSVQIMNLWDAYEMEWLSQDLALSLSWFMYALVLFIWNIYVDDKFFRIFGGTVLIISTLKVLFLDLGGDSSIQKIIFLLLFGSVTLVIAKIRDAKKSIKSPDSNFEDIASIEDGKN